jgi:poly(A) polymerase/tRNA nucleotidyltransferase (CCA-adding enzyme)
VGHENLEDLFELRVADEKASGVNAPDYVRLDELRKRIQKIHEEEQALTVKQLVINGQDVMEQLKLKPGPQIGKILKALLENVIEDPSLNTREILLERMKKFTDYDN